MDDQTKILKILEDQKKQLDRIEKLLTKQKTIHSNTVKKDNVKRPQKFTTKTMLMFLKEERFFDQPKTLSEIVQKFKDESRNIKPNGLTLPLQKLVQSRDLSRILKDGRWTYVKR